MQGVANLIEKGLTLQEIKIFTGFETQKIKDVSKYLLSDEEVENVINKKLQKKRRVEKLIEYPISFGINAMLIRR